MGFLCKAGNGMSSYAGGNYRCQERTQEVMNQGTVWSRISNAHIEQQFKGTVRTVCNSISNALNIRTESRKQYEQYGRDQNI